MSDQIPAAPGSSDNKSTAQWAYILNLVSIIFGITAIISVIMAYVSKDDAPEWLQSHYIYIIHTFWKGLLYGLISLLLITVVIGIILCFVVLVWWIIRAVKGLNALGQDKPIADPRGWGF